MWSTSGGKEVRNNLKDNQRFVSFTLISEITTAPADALEEIYIRIKEQAEKEERQGQRFSMTRLFRNCLKNSAGFSI